MSLTITTVDAFTDTMFRGNPAAVTVLPDAKPDSWMQSLAREMNLAETSFLQKREDGAYNLRWFTPTLEVDLCGHATLAAAHVLWQTAALAETEPARFHTRSGLLTAMKRDGWIELDFPATPVTAHAAPPGLLESFGVAAFFIGRSKFDYLLEVTEAELRAVTPNFDQLLKVECRGVIVTSASADPQFDFLSRFFAPAAGVNEYPVTGSAHCALAPYWAEKLNRSNMLAQQISPRSGILKVQPVSGRVLISGQAVTVLTAALTD